MSTVAKEISLQKYLFLQQKFWIQIALSKDWNSKQSKNGKTLSWLQEKIHLIGSWKMLREKRILGSPKLGPDDRWWEK